MVRNYKPYFQIDKGQLKFNNQQYKIYLNVYENGEYVSGAALGKDLCLKKSVDLSKLKKGNYEIVLSDLENDYLFTVSK